MIDSTVDPDFAALERSEALKAAPAPQLSDVPRVYHGRLASLSVRPATSAEDETSCAVSVPPAEPADPVGHLQTARLGFAAVVILIFYWLWIRQRRK